MVKNSSKNAVTDLVENQVAENQVAENQIAENQVIKYQDKSLQISIVEVMEILEKYRERIILNITKLREDYCRQTVKRFIGYRDKDGNLTEPWLKTKPIDNSNYVDMGKFVINHNTATINLLVEQRVHLIKAEDETIALEVAGLLLNDLKTFNNYTIVKNGQVNVRSLQVKISSKKLFDLLQRKGVLKKDNLPATTFDFDSEYTIKLDGLPIVPLKQKKRKIDGLFQRLAEIKVISSILSACLKTNLDTFVPEQLTELQKNYISPNLYLNFPKTKSFEFLDIRKSQRIDIGSKEILNLFKLYSANKFLERRYQVYNTETGEILSKPNFNILFENNIACRQKSISSRMKITKVDDFMKPIFDDFIGIEDNGKTTAILSKVGAKDLMRLLQKRNQGKSIDKQEILVAMRKAQTQLKQYAEKIYRDKISPLVLHVGSTGVLPKGMRTAALTATELATKYPDLQFSSAEKEGIFFEVGESIISIYNKDEYYPVKPVEV
ncbi:hypothetical protein [Mastigocoleus testarum]|uniref:hypothetical protein n=1 Tax=Mastigocoleus testarum TaxID=996925 RepID=UPI000A49451F|nr:hypothetical protein [Mastigocoleus testarum]